ncbi:Choline-sulfatase [Novipirellula aureliae]|uniref:Choline-sulfatase n=1 Tax=Novipirellula aureliae TaxID=2527966 RepID=A0A5C6DTF6_9BACT|nr:sulfatase-like hydrolase/transferase [Novipirellula aureliae]TWU39962.1 Choline-sulfatase [Novipirellula aureliae]
MKVASLFLALALSFTGASTFAAEQPNVLFIAMDDLNDWIGCMGGHPQTITPNLDRLAASGILFTNAHCTAPACNPSRSAIFSGRAPNQSGMYDNRQQMRELLPDATLLPQRFRDHGYHASGSGKMLHYFIDAPSWDDYFPSPATENPIPDSFDPPNRPVSLPRGGRWQYIDTDWAALDVSDEEFGGDWLVTKWISERLQEPHEKPFFLACGIYRPHEPWFVPKKYFEPFPLESIQLPLGYKENDLDDVPPAGVRGARNRYFEHIQSEGQWRQGIQAYLASIHFADAMLGRVLDALQSGPHAKTTIVVLWSDHGWQLGEKEHWQKYTGWRGVTRVPLIVRVPASISPALPDGTAAGETCDEPANLLSLYPTLLELCGLPPQADNDGPSLVPLLKDPQQSQPGASWTHPCITFLAEPGSYSISGRSHRYIHYADGGEELYDIVNDPFEWDNLVADGSSNEELVRLRSLAPKQFAERVAPSVASLIALPWQSLQNENDAIPRSKPDGNPFDIYLINQRTTAVEVFKIDPDGKRQPFGQVQAGQQKPQRTRPGEVWMIADPDSKQELGYFQVDDRTARAIIPASSN